MGDHPVIDYVKGDILEADAEALVNTVNCVGHMGRGIALQFKKQFPENYQLYHKACSRKEVVPGKMFVFSTGQLLNPRYIINFPTKRHWRGKSRIEDIEMGLSALAAELVERKIRSVAVPPLGCGLGGLDWDEVRPLIENSLGRLHGVSVLMFAPSALSGIERAAKAKEAPQMTTGRAALVALMDRYLAGLLDPFVSLLEVHKLLYFAQEAGQPLKLKYTKGHYGPYAENLRHVLTAVEGYFVSGYADGGDDPAKLLEVVPGAVDDARQLLAADSDTAVRFARVSSLVEGYESSLGLELLATVHWVASKQSHSSEIGQVIQGVRSWGPQKQKMTDRQIQLALDRLTSQGWLSQRDSA
jgi:O-acetyl-ADP-ribose deacetylase (regulator of RNase III)